MTLSIRPPSIDSDIFNPSFFISAGDVLTLDLADQLYLDKTDYRLTYISSVKIGEASPMSALVVDANRDITGINSISCSSLKLNGSNVDLSSLSLLSASPGTACNNKALIVGNSSQIAGLSSLTATNLTGMLQTTSQHNITSIGTLSNLTVSGGITGTLQTASQPNITSIGTLSNLTVSGGITGTLQTAAQPNISSVGTLTSLIINSVFSKGLAIQNDSTTSTASLNIVSYYQMEQGVRGSSSSTTPNTYFWRFANNDVLLMDIAGRINIGGSSINTAYRLDVNGPIRGTSFVQGSTTYDLALIPRLSLTTLGTVEPSKALVADASYGITGLRSLTLVGSGLSKGLMIQNDTTTLSASLNFVSYYQAETGVRGSANTSGANQFFLKYALSDRLIMDINGNINIGGSSINTSYKLDVAGALNCSLLTIGGVSISPQTNILAITPGTSFTSTTRASDFNLIIRNQTATTGAQAGIAFTVDDTDLTMITPSVNLYATRTATSTQAGLADFAISTRSGSNWLSPMAERMRITQAGYIRFGSSSSTAKLDITSSANLLSGSWQRAMRIANDQTTPIEFEVQIYNDVAGGTSGVALGTATSDPLRLMVGNSTQCYINSSGRLAVDLPNWSPEGTIHASGAIWSNYGFHCKSSSISPMYRWQNSTTSYPCIGNHVNASAGIRFATCDANWVYNGYAPCYGGAYTNSSDRRLKKILLMFLMVLIRL